MIHKSFFTIFRQSLKSKKEVMINSSSVNEEMARKKGYVRMALNIYQISTEKK